MHTDGVYVTDLPTHGMENSKHYLKFHDDSTVLAISSPYKLEKVRKLLESPSIHIGKGKFKVTDDSIKFVTKTQSGLVVYEGIIEHDQKINLKVRSYINGYEFQEVYTFQPY